MKQTNYRRGRHSVTGLYTHLVFVTKYRRKVFTSEHIEYMREVCHGVAKKMNFKLIQLNGESDHIHCLIAAILILRFPDIKTLAQQGLNNS